jgi:hypothetical protein
MKLYRIYPGYGAICVLSLFLGVYYDAGVILRPFDALVGGGLLLLAGTASIRGKGQHLKLGIPYYLFIILYTYRSLNGVLLSGVGIAVKELIQGIEFLVLIHIIASSTKEERSRKRFLKYLYFGFGVISLYVAGWHISTGKIAGYKELGDAKLSFSLFSLFATVKYILHRRPNRQIFIVVGSLILVLLSGERKGWVALVAGLISLYIVRKDSRFPSLVSQLFRPRVLAVVTVIFLALTVAALQVEYVSTQISNLQDAFVLASSLKLDMDFSRVETSGSNLVRVYLLLFTIRTMLENPVFGIGTGQWMQEIQQAAADQGGRFVKGAHSEYQRFAVENGLTGLVLYVLSWFYILRNLITFARHDSLVDVESIYISISLSSFGAVINMFLGGGALNILFWALPIGMLIGIRTNYYKKT